MSKTIGMKVFWKVLVLLVLLNGCEKEPLDNSKAPSIDETTLNISCFYTQKIEGRFEICKSENGKHSTLTKANGKDKWWPKHSALRNETLLYQSDNTRDVNDYASASLWMLDTNHNQTLLIEQGAYGWEMQGLCNWSHSGNEIVMAAVDTAIGRWQVYITDANGEFPRRITTRDDVDYFDPVFSNDDKKVYCSAIPESEPKVNSKIEIMRVDVATGIEERLTYNDHRDHHPDVSPDEKTIIYESLVDPDYLSIGKWVVKELDLSTSSEKIVIEDDNINLFPRYSSVAHLLYLTELNVETFQMQATIYNTSTDEKFNVNDTENITMNPDPF